MQNSWPCLWLSKQGQEEAKGEAEQYRVIENLGVELHSLIRLRKEISIYIRYRSTQLTLQLHFLFPPSNLHTVRDIIGPQSC